MNTKPANKAKDRKLFASIVKAYKANTIAISVDTARLNRPNSPVWDPVENVLPLLAMLTISVASMFAINVLAGVAILLLTALVYSTLVVPLLAQRVSGRTITAATENVHNWDLLWKKGGLAVTLIGMKSSRVTFPHDWRDFAIRSLPQVSVDGTEIHDAFKSAKDADADASADRKSLGDVNM
jgi:hypothetical protein